MHEGNVFNKEISLPFCKARFSFLFTMNNLVSLVNQTTKFLSRTVNLEMVPNLSS